ncbi:MAG: hypothetical protein GY699_14105 [Desulfobacteraceae bacterium]|nr:hypothetical protein [Desulfobacteraceae bacterium]
MFKVSVTKCFILALILWMVFLPLSCSKEDKNKEKEKIVSHEPVTPKSKKPEHKVPKKQVIKDKNPKKHLFVELVYEIGRRPFDKKRVSRPDEAARLNGYVLEGKNSSAEKILYPAMGKKWPNQKEVVFWVGYRIVDRVADPMRYQALACSKKREFELITGEDSSIEGLIQNGCFFATLLPKIKVGIALDKQYLFTLSLSDKTIKIDKTQNKPILIKELIFKPGELAATIAGTFKKMGYVQTEKDLDGLSMDLKSIFPESTEDRIYLRLSAKVHTLTGVGKFDLKSQWEKADKALLEGPYEDALKALEKVLLAVPIHAEALRRWGIAKNLVAQKNKPAVISGEIIFPEGMPTEKQKRIWKKYHSGYAILSKQGTSEKQAMTYAVISDNRFRLTVPTGTYRLRVSIPGFKEYDQPMKTGPVNELQINILPGDLVKNTLKEKPVEKLKEKTKELPKETPKEMVKEVTKENSKALVNIIASNEGGTIISTSNDLFSQLVDGKDEAVTGLKKGDHAVFKFKNNATAYIDRIEIPIFQATQQNIASFDLLVSTNDPDKGFEHIETFYPKNMILFKSIFQPFNLNRPVRAKYLKIIIGPNVKKETSPVQMYEIRVMGTLRGQ